MDRQVAPVLSLAKYLRNWRLPGVNTIISLLTFLGFVLSNWNEIPAISSLWQPLTRRFTASVTLETDDKLTKEVRDWLVAHVLVPRQERFWEAHTNLAAIEQRCEDEYHGRDSSRKLSREEGIKLLPENRSTWFLFGRRLFVVHQKAKYAPRSFTWDEGKEAIRIDCIGRSVQPILDFLETCRRFSRKTGETFVHIHTAVYGRWQESALKRARPLETIDLAQELKHSLVDDIQDYLEPQTSEFYAECGIPYRRGYLLFGPPGTGKTSLCIAIAGITKLPLYILRIPGLDGDKELEELFSSLPSRCLVLVEDIDAIPMERAVQRKKSKKGRRKAKKERDESNAPSPAPPSCTLSGVLNVLDGVASQEGRVVIMTANHPELLDPALTRPGRIDRKFYLGYMSRQSAHDMFRRILRKANSAQPGAGTFTAKSAKREEAELDRLAAEFSRAIPDAAFSPAQIQEYLLSHRDDAAGAVRSAPAWVEQELAAMALNDKRAKEEAEESDDSDDEKEPEMKEAVKSIEAAPVRNFEAAPVRSIEAAPARSFEVAPTRSFEAAPARSIEAVVPVRSMEAPQENELLQHHESGRSIHSAQSLEAIPETGESQDSDNSDHEGTPREQEMMRGRLRRMGSMGSRKLTDTI